MLRTTYRGRARRRTSGSIITVTTSYLDCNDDETDIEVECEVTPGEREIRYGDSACPGSPPEVEIVSAVGADGNDYREAIEEDAGWFDRVAEQAISIAGEYDGPDTIEEARGER